MAGERTQRNVFVTVGTTSFNELVAATTEKSFMKLLVNKGYSHLTLQIGRGSFEPRTPPDVAGLQLEYYRFKPTLQEDMQRASLIISHGGSGSITESLSLKKPLIVVVNEALMHNHQTELARKMAQEGHCLFTTHTELYATMEGLKISNLTTYEPGKPEKFGDFLDRVMGFREKID